jgi:hypothetical protein
MGFAELVKRGGGQSGNALNSKKKSRLCAQGTATVVQEFLQCPICGGVVRDALILPWDPEMRTTCGACIRDSLTQNGFRCPLTGMEGVSPDDLLPNHALRKAAEQFIKGVMDKMEEIEKQVDDDAVADDMAGERRAASVLKSDGGDKGVVLSRRANLADKKKQDDDDPFGAGDDDPFGGDVFAVEAEEAKEEEESGAGAGVAESVDKKLETPAQEKPPELEKDNEKEQVVPKDAVKAAPAPVPAESREPQRKQTKDNTPNHNRHDPSSQSPRSTSDSNDQGGNLQTPRTTCRIYMGPAAGAVGGPPEETRRKPATDAELTVLDDGQRDRSYRGRSKSAVDGPVATADAKVVGKNSSWNGRRKR